MPGYSDKAQIHSVTLAQSGGVLGRQATLPFGEDFAESGTQQKQHITSYERDAESNLDYAINRGYAATVGRFQQADPYKASGYMVDPQSWNRYAYTRNEPINLLDPIGLNAAALPSLGAISVSAGDGWISADSPLLWFLWLWIA